MSIFLASPLWDSQKAQRILDAILARADAYIQSVTGAHTKSKARSVASIPFLQTFVSSPSLPTPSDHLGDESVIHTTDTDTADFHRKTKLKAGAARKRMTEHEEDELMQKELGARISDASSDAAYSRLTAQPSILSGGKLRDYQLEG